MDNQNNNYYYQQNPNAQLNQPNPYQENAQNKIQADIEAGIGHQEITNSIRLGFIKKVYGILSAQLLITCLFISFTFVDSIRSFYLSNLALFYLCVGVSLILGFTLICFKNVARTSPTNFIILGIWTFCEAYMVSVCAATYDPTTVLIAGTLTASVTVALTLYACTTKTDFTFCGGMLFACGCLMFLMTLFLIIFGFSSKTLPVFNIIYCGLGVLLYSMYLIYDTQLVMGKFGVEYSIDDYILAAMMIYIDIIQLFLYILRMLGKK